jgi:GH15 family glucan-1,4-alpha-glucosidase
MKLKGRRFETVSEVQRESQLVLNSNKENEFQATFEAWKKTMESLYTFPRVYLKEMAAKIE